MIVKKWIEYSKEIDISISAEDIQVILNESDDPLETILYQLNSIAGFLRGISDDKIAEMRDSQKETIAKFLSDQSTRYRQPAVSAGA